MGIRAPQIRSLQPIRIEIDLRCALLLVSVDNVIILVFPFFTHNTSVQMRQDRARDRDHFDTSLDVIRRASAEPNISQDKAHD